MKPIKFKHQNIEIAKHQDEYQTLPSLKLQCDEGDVISCWEPSWLDRVKILFGGKIWVSIMTFNKPLMPFKLSTKRSDVFVFPDEMHISPEDM